MALQRKQFVKRIEDFTCEMCGADVKGNGYTDHCPECLYSRHVDVFPGDRQAGCGGLMEPVGMRQERGKWRIEYRCKRCGYWRVNDVVEGDNFDKIIQLSRGGAGN